MKLTRNLEELNAAIGLSFCEGVGSATAAKLITKSGSPKGVFDLDKKTIGSLGGISKKVYDCLSRGINWKLVDKEVAYIENNNINYVFISDPAYPRLLKLIDQPPPILFFTGQIELINASKNISIVGTRHATQYGLDMVRDFVSSISPYRPCIISGLALGIDVAAHRAAITNHLTTFGVVAHGLKTIYPAVHQKISKQMNDTGGGLITEFFSDEQPNRENFPKRNRIIAGISYATIVVEAASKGGALITAYYANKFKRKVYALPGRYNDPFSKGCNDLISKGQAVAINSIDALTVDLGFTETVTSPVPKKIMADLTPDEQIVLNILQSRGKLDLDTITEHSQRTLTTCSHLLLSMEMKGVLRSLPGKLYELV